MSDFKREERYIVIKRKHLDEASESTLRGVIAGLDLDTVECVVVEHDWPNYGHVWETVEQVANGTFDPDKTTRLQADNEALRARVAELEEGLAGIENCAHSYHGCRQTAEDAADWMNAEATRLLDGCSNAWLLRKQAEAVSAVATHLQEASDKADAGFDDESDTACTLLIAKSIALADAQRLLNQAAALERQSVEGVK